jgi:hypothetical protein
MLACAMCGGILELAIWFLCSIIMFWTYWKYVCGRYAAGLCRCGGMVKLVIGVLTFGVFGACGRCVQKLCRCKKECHCHDKETK